LVLGTIRAHMKTIYAKWGVHGQAAFVAEARRRGLLGD
jgi:DNA-binding CsgD family transcriptional regulator